MTELATVERPDALEAVLTGIGTAYRYPARRFVDYLRREGRSLADPVSWQDYLRTLEAVQDGDRMAGRKYSAAAYNLHLQATKRCVRWALENEAAHLDFETIHRAETALKALKSKKKPEPSSYVPEKVMTPEQVQQLVEEAGRPRWGDDHRTARPDAALWIEFLWTTGLRVSELCSILLADIEETNGHATIRVMGKGSKERTVRCPRELVDRCRRFFQGTVYLFESPRSAGEPKPYSRNTVSMVIHRIGGTVLGKRISAHALRHSIGTHLYRTTKNSKAVQNFLGHSSVSTTLSYYVHDAFEYADVERFTRLGEHNGGDVTGSAAELQTMHPHEDDGQLELTLAAVGE